VFARLAIYGSDLVYTGLENAVIVEQIAGER
jgi:hypothetical protein